MRLISQGQQFRRDYKRAKRRGKDELKIIGAIEILALMGEMPSKFRPHKLTGRWQGFWECHQEPDWLLIYSVSKTEVLLVRTGTHADLFE